MIVNIDSNIGLICYCAKDNMLCISKIKFKQWLLFWLFSFSIIAQSVKASEWQLLGSIGVASNHIDKGVALLDDQATPEMNTLLQHESGLFASLWIQQVDIAGLVVAPQSEEWQFAISTGYHWQFRSPWSVSLDHSWYRYSSVETKPYINYDYQQWNAGLHYREWFSLAYGQTDELWGFAIEQRYFSLSTRHAFSNRLLGEWEFGSVSNEWLGETIDYYFSRLNIGYAFKTWNLELQHHYSSSDADELYRSERVGNHFAIKVGYHF